MNADARFCCHCGKPIEVQQGFNFSAGRLLRARNGRMMGGVCAGLANHYGWDPALVRLAAVVLFFVGCGSIFLAYIAAWIIVPQEPLYFVTPPPPPASYAGSAPIS